MTSIYHQLGFSESWNFESFTEGIGDGLIIAARYMDREGVEKLGIKVRSVSIFDTQLFIPGVSPGKLFKTYSFHPTNNVDEFKTEGFIANGDAQKCADENVRFQLSLGFQYLLIPTRRYEGVPTEFIDTLQAQFVDPFVNAFNNIDQGANTLLQLVINEHMLKNQEFMNQVLDWVTGIYEISGVYLIVERKSPPKQIHDIDLLVQYLRITKALRDAGFIVMLGYVNTEAILLTLADPNIVTLGSWENLRCFSPKPFEEKKPGRGGGQPNYRIYVPKLLQWVDTNYINAIKNLAEVDDSFFGDNEYHAMLFADPSKLKPTKPIMYKHYFVEMTRQIQDITQVTDIERFLAVSHMIDEAISWFEKISNSGVVLDSDSRGSHLFTWQTAINIFAKEQGWIS
jgi:hypothetical protein